LLDPAKRVMCIENGEELLTSLFHLQAVVTDVTPPGQSLRLL
jgi:hypothetical protein